MLIPLVMGILAQANPPAPAPDAREVLKKTLDSYASAKTYQGTWSYTSRQGAVERGMLMEVRAKSPTRLVVRMTAKPGQKPAAGESLPEIQVVIDGKTAWFENSSGKVYYRVPLPRNARISPLLFMPQIPAASAVTRTDEKGADGKAIHILQAQTLDGAISRMEVSEGFRIRRMTTETQFGLVKSTAVISVDKETFDADIPDRDFTYKPGPGLKEIAAPPGSAALFGAAESDSKPPDN